MAQCLKRGRPGDGGLNEQVRKRKRKKRNAGILLGVGETHGVIFCLTHRFKERSQGFLQEDGGGGGGGGGGLEGGWGVCGEGIIFFPARKQHICIQCEKFR